ncbi:variant erythrocyte surface antigen-1 family protein [Babesia caballi]|uniref:Variant erythrocyte surface antigen-1 family protein n=1 Tax=Babesia caballi TaxID=5871 RepID=A0AAV4LNT3_BABCB|nr:variant erythrocyte surface antigen-1 family protein [Babesia caballi]
MTTSHQKSQLTEWPENLKEVIDWFLRVGGKDQESKGNDKKDELKKAVDRLGDYDTAQTVLESSSIPGLFNNVARALQRFIGYDESGERELNGSGIGLYSVAGGYASSYSIQAKWNGLLDQPESQEAKKAALIFLGSMPILYFGLTYLYWKCSSRQSEYWASYRLNVSADPLGLFMSTMGYTPTSMLQNKGGTQVATIMESDHLYGFEELRINEKYGKDKLTSNPTDCALYALHRASKEYLKSKFQSGSDGEGINANLEETKKKLLKFKGACSRSAPELNDEFEKFLKEINVTQSATSKNGDSSQQSSSSGAAAAGSLLGTAAVGGAGAAVALNRLPKKSVTEPPTNLKETIDWLALVGGDKAWGGDGTGKPEKLEDALNTFKSSCGNMHPDFRDQIGSFLSSARTPAKTTALTDSPSPAGPVAGTLSTLGLGGGAAAAYLLNISHYPALSTSLSDCPSNLKQAIDWILRVTGKDGGVGGDSGGADGLATAVNALISTAGLNNRKSPIRIEQDLINTLAEGLAKFIGYESGSGNIGNGGIAVGGQPLDPGANSGPGYKLTYHRSSATWKDQVEGGDGNSETKKKLCAKIFLGCLPLYYQPLTYIYWGCHEKGGGWGNQTLGGGALKSYFDSQGLLPLYVDRSKRGAHIAESALKGFQEFATAATSLSAANSPYVSFTNELQKKVTTNGNQLSTICPLSALYHGASCYFRYRQITNAKHAVRAPQTIREMLYFLAALQFSSAYDEINGHIGTLLTTELNVADSSNRNSNNTLSSDQLKEYLRASCAFSSSVLGLIQGPGASDKSDEPWLFELFYGIQGMCRQHSGSSYHLSTCAGPMCHVPMGFKAERLRQKTGNGARVYHVLKPICGDVSSPFRQLCEKLGCLTKRTPRSVGDLFGFTWHLKGQLSITLNNIDGATWFSELKDKLPFSYQLKNDSGQKLNEFVGAGHTEHDGSPMDLSSLHVLVQQNHRMCYGTNKTCGPYLSPLTISNGATFGKPAPYASTYLSWMVYLTDDLETGFQEFLDEFKNIDCTKTGCRAKAGGSTCQQNHQPGTHGTSSGTCSCDSLVHCGGVLPLLYRYGFTFSDMGALFGAGVPFPAPIRDHRPTT